MSNFWRILIILNLVLTYGCSSSLKKQSKSSTWTPPELRVNQADNDSSGDEKIEVIQISEEEKRRSKNITYVALSMSALSFSHIGVIKELEKNNLSPHVFIGTGFSALVSALYLDSKNANDFEWKILKLKNDVFGDSLFSKSFSFNLPAHKLKKLNNYLREIFKDKKILDFSERLHIAKKENEQSYSFFPQNTLVSDAIVSSLTKGHYAVVSLNRTKYPTLVQYARTLNQGVVVCVNPSQSKNDQSELLSDFYYSIDLRDFKKDSFNKITEISYRSAKVMKENIRKLYEKII